MSEPLDPRVVQLLQTRVDSFEKLDVVLALRDRPGTTMTMDELQQALRLSREILRELVTELSAAKVVEHTARGAVKLSAVDAVDIGAIDALASAWNRDRALVARTLAELSVARIRDMAERALIKKPR